MSTEEPPDDSSDLLPMTPELQIPSAIGIAILMILAISGNIMTLVAYVIDKKLHTVYNFYIFNLAVADLLISCISMPFYAVYTLTGFTWPFGSVLCKIWLTVDFTVCFETILIMLILSFDRLLLLLLGPLYQAKITMKVAAAQVSISWVVSFLLYGPAIISWDFWAGYSTVEDMDCDTEFANHFGYTTATAIVEFVIPFCCMSFVNALIYYKIRFRQKVRPYGLSRLNVATIEVKSVQPTNNVAPNIQNKQHAATSTTDHFNSCSLSRLQLNCHPHEQISTRTHQHKQRTFQTQHNKKAARLLAFLVLVFLVCWAPYSVITIIISFCDTCASDGLYEAFTWLLWIKSALNPALYAYNSLQYRSHFKRFLTCHCRKRNLVEADDHSNTSRAHQFTLPS